MTTPHNRYTMAATRASNLIRNLSRSPCLARTISISTPSLRVSPFLRTTSIVNPSPSLRPNSSPNRFYSTTPATDIKIYSFNEVHYNPLPLPSFNTFPPKPSPIRFYCDPSKDVPSTLLTIDQLSKQIPPKPIHNRYHPFALNHSILHPRLLSPEN